MWTRTGYWALLPFLILAVGGCASTPPERVSPAVPAKAAVSLPMCLPCSGQTGEIERLRQDVAIREEEVRELRSNERVQVKVLQESKREVTRAKVKLRRLATRADAASYIAEVEVALDSLRSSLGTGSNVPDIIAVQRLLDSTAAPFAEGDYGAAMDRAAEAEQLMARASDRQKRQPSHAHGIASAQSKARLKSTIAGKPRNRTVGMAPSRKNG
jgi:hypothetical protein